MGHRALVSRLRSTTATNPGNEGEDWGFFEHPRSEKPVHDETAEVQVSSLVAESPRDCGFRKEKLTDERNLSGKGSPLEETWRLIAESS